MNAKGMTTNQESKAMMTASTLMRLAGLSALLTGLCFIVIGMFHQENVPASVTTATWVNVHIAATALGFFGLFGMAGLYARQVEKAGWLGLIGFILLTLWMTLVCGFSFVEAFILPHLATESPKFVAGVLGMLTGVPSEVDLGVLPMLWNITGILIILGPALFGFATFRARILPRWAGGLLAVGAVLVPISAMIPAAYQPEFIMIPIGLAFVWLGYALVSERQAKTVMLMSASSINPEPSKAL
ncbi:MAG: hypothetical protein KF893_13275 [Caldilineaceae bacterium]|nr:hypothetical protein [Caldilineaceae bacterium]